MNVTLVANYGTKSTQVKAFLATINNILVSEFGPLFTPYSSKQVHATIIGLEHKTVNDKFLNANFLTFYRSEREINLTGLVHHLKKVSFLPMKIRIGGYSLDNNYGFTSQGQHPMKRSFSIQSNKVVCMGWPVLDNEVVPQLANLRKSFEPFNILHKWHQHPDDRDNDFYFVLGQLNRSALKDDVINNIENKLRHYFSAQPPLELVLSIRDLIFVAYTDLTLEPSDTYTLPLTEVNEDISNLIELFDR